MTTGPSQDTRLLVADRDRWRCVACGHDLSDGTGDIQHRRARGMGGTLRDDANRPDNLILLCRPCHQHVETHRVEARSRGWAVPQHGDPATVPVEYHDGGVWVLHPDGTRTLWTREAA